VADGDSQRLHAIVLRGIDHQPAPPAPDVHQALARLQPQLAADVVQLTLLGDIDVLVRVGEVGTRVDHVLVEPQGIEVVGDFVVIGNRLTIPLPGVALAADLCGLPFFPRRGGIG
jgi:hypothetical protein